MDQISAIHILIGMITISVILIGVLLVYYTRVATRTKRFRRNFFKNPDKRGVIYLKYMIKGKEGAFLDKVIVIDTLPRARIKVQIIGQDAQTGFNLVTKKYLGGQRGRRNTCTINNLYPEMALKYLLLNATRC